MIYKEIKSKVQVFNNIDELEPKDAELIHKALATRLDAHSPYSDFQVGAAVRLANNDIIIGNNQENSSYPAGLCAERVALFYASAVYPEEPVKTLAVSAAPKGQTNLQPVPPCGSCRQVIAEFEHKFNRPIKIYFMGNSGPIMAVNSIECLLPLAFNKSFLR